MCGGSAKLPVGDPVLSWSGSVEGDRLWVVERFALPLVSFLSRVVTRPGFVVTTSAFLVDRVFGGVRGGE